MVGCCRTKSLFKKWMLPTKSNVKKILLSHPPSWSDSNLSFFVLFEILTLLVWYSAVHFSSRIDFLFIHIDFRCRTVLTDFLDNPVLCSCQDQAILPVCRIAGWPRPYTQSLSDVIRHQGWKVEQTSFITGSRFRE